MNFYWVVDYTSNSIQGPFLTVEQASIVNGYQTQVCPDNDVRVVRQEVIWLQGDAVPAPVYPEAPVDVTDATTETQPEDQP